MNLGDLNKVWEIKHLKTKVGGDEARKILERIAKQVQPIMRKHNWRVKLLSEFCPKNPALLGLNVGGGVNVKLRLRRPNKDWDFYPFDQILDTMLHELCHNAHGPHNAQFYKLWDDLRKECEELMAKGITGSGEGFDLPGRRLGGFSRQPALSSLRHTALAAAEKRARLGILQPSGPKRLGGDNSIMVALSPVQAAAMAAERRLQDEIWCASGAYEVEEGDSGDDVLQKHVVQTTGNSRSCNDSDTHVPDAVSRKRNRETYSHSSSHSSNAPTESNLVDLTVGTSMSESTLYKDAISQKSSYQTGNKSFPHSANSPSKSSLVGISADASTSAYVYHQDASHDTEESTTWECLTCTLLNAPLAPICEICSAPKPRSVEDKYKFWSCKFCTLENSAKLEKCKACGQWRYSHGVPVAASAPNLGT